MTASAVALVLVSAFVHASWNARTHAGGDRRATLTIGYLTGALLLSPWLIADPPTEVVGFLLLSGCAHAGYIWFLSGAYDRGELAATYPVARGSAPLIVAVVGIWLLDQTPAALTVAGIVVVAVGLALIGGVAFGWGQLHAVGMAITTGAFIASYTLLDARGASETSGVGFFSASSFLAGVALVATRQVSVERLRGAARHGAVIGMMSASAYALVLLAYTRADAANVATLRATSILFGLLLVRRTLTRNIVIGGLFVVAGSIMVAS